MGALRVVGLGLAAVVTVAAGGQYGSPNLIEQIRVAAPLFHQIGATALRDWLWLIPGALLIASATERMTHVFAHAAAAPRIGSARPRTTR